MQRELPDFDTLKNLAATDPGKLEQLRQEHINALIDSAPKNQQRRLRGLQFQIDAQRKIHSQPMASCIKISQMMHESFGELRVLLNDLAGQQPQQPSRRSEPRREEPSKQRIAQVLQFQAT